MSGDVLTESTGGALRDVVPFSIVATGTILTYDLLCTIDEEVEYVWKSRQSLGTVLFYLNRYTPFIDTFISLNLLTGKHSAQACERNFKVILWLIVIGTLISEYILCLRTYALWERRRSIGIALSIIYSGLFAAGIGIISIEAQSLHYEDPPLPDIPGCFMRSASSIVFIDYILILIAETIMVTLTIAKAVKHLRHTRSPLVVTLYRDGILFYFILLTVTIANVIIPVAGPPALINWLATPQRVLHSILCTRVLLFILKSRHKHTSANSLPTSTSRTPSSNVLSSIPTFISPTTFLESALAHWNFQSQCEGGEVRVGMPEIVEMDDLGRDQDRERGIDEDTIGRLRDEWSHGRIDEVDG